MGAIVLIMWFSGYVISARTYYRRRCGIAAAPGRPGILTAAMPSFIWPVMWFVGWYRDPVPCTHPDHVLGRHQAVQERVRVRALINEERRGMR